MPHWSGFGNRMSKDRHDEASQAVLMNLLRVWRPWSVAAGVVLGIAGGALGAQAASNVTFPSQEMLRKVQLAALACARENTVASCDQARQLGDPLMDHPRLPANCKDLIWEILEKAQPTASNSFSRREALADPAQRLLLVCRSTEKPEAATPPQATPGGGGLNFGGR